MKTNLTILALALGIACMQSATAQSFKKVNVQNNAPIVQVASGGASVWALASNGNPYVLRGKTFGLATNTISLSQIAVGGGNAVQADQVWALNSSGNVYRASKSGSTWIFSQVLGVALDGITVGPGYWDNCHPYEVWGLNTSSQVFRYNYCTSQFDQQSGTLCDIHVGGGDIWGAQCGPNVFRFNFPFGAFVQIPDPFGAFPQLTVGSSGDLWAIDTGTFTLYHYGSDTGGWVNHGALLGSPQVQAGNGVWVLDGSKIYRYEPSSSASDHLVQVFGPSDLVSISVGSGGGVWGIDSTHHVYAFSTP